MYTRGSQNAWVICKSQVCKYPRRVIVQFGIDRLFIYVRDTSITAVFIYRNDQFKVNKGPEQACRRGMWNVFV